MIESSFSWKYCQPRRLLCAEIPRNERAAQAKLPRQVSIGLTVIMSYLGVGLVNFHDDAPSSAGNIDNIYNLYGR